VQHLLVRGPDEQAGLADVAHVEDVDRLGAPEADLSEDFEARMAPAIAARC
jgi:hypothetical protein